MSASLYWKPVVPEPEHVLPDALKFALRRRYPLEGGQSRILALEDTAYLEGLRDAGCDGAQELIDAIKKHDRVEVLEQW